MGWIWLCFGLGFVGAMMGFVKTPVSGWLKSQSPKKLCFGPPLVKRVSDSTKPLASLGMVIFFLQPAEHTSTHLMWYFFVPWIALMGCGCLWFAGPRTITLDLVRGTCQRGIALPFIFKKRTCALTDESVIYAYGSRYDGYITLWIGNKKANSFLLAQANSRDEALAFAHQIGSLAQIEVQETTTQAMRDRILACKRS